MALVTDFFLTSHYEAFRQRLATTEIRIRETPTPAYDICAAIDTLRNYYFVQYMAPNGLVTLSGEFPAACYAG